jgi:O-antigen/teichoic acid export membrane protein
LRAREVILVSGALLVQHATVFATNVVIGRELGAGSLGELSLFRSLSTLILIVTPLGLEVALLKHASLYHDRPAELRSLTRLLRVLVAGLNVVLLLVLAVWLGPVLGRFYPGIVNFERLAVLTMVGVVFAADLLITGALFRAENRTGPYFVYTMYIQYTLRMLLSVVAVAVGGGVLAIIAINTAVAGLTVGLIELDRFRRRPTGPVLPMARMVQASANILSESGWMWGALLLYGSIRLLDVIVLGALTTAGVVGQYSAMNMVAQVIAIYPGALSQTLGPRIAVLYGAGDQQSVQSEIGSYLRKATLLSGYLLGGVAVFGTDLDLVFGQSFAFPRPLVLLLALGWYVSAVLAPMSYGLSMTGRHRQDLGVIAAGLLLMLACLFAFIPWLGGTGAALAVAATFVFINVIRTGLVIRVLGHNPLRLQHLAPPLVFLAAAALCCLLGKSFTERSFLLLVIECVTYSAAALALYLAFFAQTEERQAILRLSLGGAPAK